MLYLLYGPDEFTRSEMLHELQASIPPDVASLNISYLDGRKLKPTDLAATCEALPFLAERRLVIVSDALKHTKAGKERDDLRAYLEHVPPTCDLIFVEGDVDRRSSLFTYIKKHGQVSECLPRQGHELLNWLKERAKLLGARLDKATAQHLVEYVGNDSRTLITELGKLATYAGHGATITTAMIDLLVQDQHEQNLFHFLDQLSMRKQRDALQGLRALLDDGQPPAYILFMLVRQVRILLGVRDLQGQRLSPNEIAAQLGQKPFVIRKALEQARGFEAGELTHLHDRLVEMDHAIKTGRIPATVALDLLVMEVCERGAAGGSRPR
jgi:DNA polymerase-3 subunit delta